MRRNAATIHRPSRPNSGHLARSGRRYPPPGIPRVCHGMTGAFGRPRRPNTMLDQRSGQDRGNPIKYGRVHRNARGHPGPRRRATIAGQMRPVLGPDRIDQCR